MSIAVDPSKGYSGIETERWLRMYRRMVMIRQFEDQVNQLYTRALMPGRLEGQIQQSENAALALVIGTHDQEDVFDGDVGSSITAATTSPKQRQSMTTRWGKT